jgi:hypothetical protein
MTKISESQSALGVLSPIFLMATQSVWLQHMVAVASSNAKCVTRIVVVTLNNQVSGSSLLQHSTSEK